MGGQATANRVNFSNMPFINNRVMIETTFLSHNVNMVVSTNPWISHLFLKKIKKKKIYVLVRVATLPLRDSCEIKCGI
jgi:hypothetical protein